MTLKALIVLHIVERETNSLQINKKETLNMTQANWTQVETNENGINFVKSEDLKKGDEFIGTFVESLISPKFKTLQYKFSKETGGTFVLPSSGKLKSLMTSIEPGMLCKVVYDGKVVIQSGDFKGTEAHNWLVYFDKNGINKKVDSFDTLKAISNKQKSEKLGVSEEDFIMDWKS